ncbi:MAG TPA: hypothetical protein VIH54_17565, partial [Chthoniobacterales bacterium]
SRWNLGRYTTPFQVGRAASVFNLSASRWGQNIAAALTGKMTVDQALRASQTEVERAVRQGGYLK